MVKAREAITIQIDPESDLARALRAVDEAPIVLDSNGARFLVTREPENHDADDAEAFRAALRAAAGVFTPEEAERLKSDIYRWREEGSKPPILHDIPD
ncbi:MAG: hypothetical protein ACRDJC_13740 [Thermomicrobiales bacterium]